MVSSTRATEGDEKDEGSLSFFIVPIEIRGILPRDPDQEREKPEIGLVVMKHQMNQYS